MSERTPGKILFSIRKDFEKFRELLGYMKEATMKSAPVGAGSLVYTLSQNLKKGEEIMSKIDEALKALEWDIIK